MKTHFATHLADQLSASQLAAVAFAAELAAEQIEDRSHSVRLGSAEWTDLLEDRIAFLALAKSAQRIAGFAREPRHNI